MVFIKIILIECYIYRIDIFNDRSEAIKIGSKLLDNISLFNMIDELKQKYEKFHYYLDESIYIHSFTATFIESYIMD